MEHPIGNMMKTTMENIRDMVDVNTVIGEPVVGPNDITIIPVSKVSFGFVAGGGEYTASDKSNSRAQQTPEEPMPFAGGSGAGVSVQPVGFLVVGKDGVKMLPAQTFTVADRVVELLPQVVSDVKSLFADAQDKKGEKAAIVREKTVRESVAMPPLKSGKSEEDMQ